MKYPTGFPDELGVRHNTHDAVWVTLRLARISTNMKLPSLRQGNPRRQWMRNVGDFDPTNDRNPH